MGEVRRERKIQKACLFFHTKKGCKYQDLCPYLHDISLKPSSPIPCKWFNSAGGCHKGENCFFSHVSLSSESTKMCGYGDSCLFYRIGKCKWTHQESKSENPVVAREAKSGPRKKNVRTGCKCTHAVRTPKNVVSDICMEIEQGTKISKKSLAVAEWKGLVNLILLSIAGDSSITLREGSSVKDLKIQVCLSEDSGSSDWTSNYKYSGIAALSKRAKVNASVDSSL